MRQGELLALQWGDIDFDKGSIEVKRSLSQVGKEFIVKEPKSKSGKRTILLPPFVLASAPGSPHRRVEGGPDHS